MPVQREMVVVCSVEAAGYEVVKVGCGVLVTLTLRQCSALLPAAVLVCIQVHGRLYQMVSSRQQPSIQFKHYSSAISTWIDIETATKLTSVSLRSVQTDSQQADVVSALTALPDLEQLTWRHVYCGQQRRLSDSSLLQQATRLTYLDLKNFRTAALQHLSSLTKLQHLSIGHADRWAAAGCPGLQELKALTSLKLDTEKDIPASTSQLTALQQLEVANASPSAINGLQVLTALTQLKVRRKPYGGAGATRSLRLQLTGLQHLELGINGRQEDVPLSVVASCKQLRVLSLLNCSLTGPGSLVASTTLQHLELNRCRVAARPATWRRVFPGPGQLPHLTSLQLPGIHALEVSDVERIVAACGSSLQKLHIDTLQGTFVPVLAGLPALTSLELSYHGMSYETYGFLKQLTGVKEVTVKSNSQRETWSN